MTIASIASMPSPARARRRLSWRRLKPLSTRIRVGHSPSTASMTSALPSLPEPRQQKRSTSLFLSAHLFGDLRQDLAPGRARVRLAFLVLHAHVGAVAGVGGNDDAKLLGIDLGIAAEDAREKTLFIAHPCFVIRIEVTHEIKTLGAIAILDRETAAVERQAHAAPGTIKGLVDQDLRLRGARTGHKTRVLRLRRRTRLGRRC